MSRRVRVTAVRKPFDPEAFAAVLVAAALARLDEEAQEDGESEAEGSS